MSLAKLVDRIAPVFVLALGLYPALAALGA
jgi:hypothetical protein